MAAENTTTRKRIPPGLLLLVLFFLPWRLPVIYTFQLSAVLIAVLFAVSLNILMGYGGMISFGHAGYYALAAYTSALLFKHVSLALPLAFLAGPVMAAAGALLFGFFCVRAGGSYFLMLTLAFAQLIYAVVYQWYHLTGGDDGISGLLLSGVLGTPVGYYYFSLVVVTACLIAIHGLLHSPFGYTLQAIRDNPSRVEALGVPVKRYQLLAFTLAGFFAGVAGTLYTFFNGQISPQIAYWKQSAEPFMSVIIGGPGTFWGPVVGAALYKFLGSQIARYSQYSHLYLGLVSLAVGLFLPRGVVGSLLLLKRGQPPKGGIPATDGRTGNHALGGSQ